MTRRMTSAAGTGTAPCAANWWLRFRGVAFPVALGMLGLVTARAEATQEYFLPTLFDVSGVAVGDVLNVRTAPDASSAVIGSLAPDARNIEVVGLDRSGRWAQINTRERSGWVALRYLAYQVGVWDHGRLPESLRCFGTEPFWSLAARDSRLVLSLPDAPDLSLPLRSVLDTGVFRDPRRAILADEGAERLMLVATPKACSDGMSDRAYGLEATVVREGEGGTQMLAGCCSIAP